MRLKHMIMAFLLSSSLAAHAGLEEKENKIKVGSTTVVNNSGDDFKFSLDNEASILVTVNGDMISLITSSLPNPSTLTFINSNEIIIDRENTLVDKKSNLWKIVEKDNDGIGTYYIKSISNNWNLGIKYVLTSYRPDEYMIAREDIIEIYIPENKELLSKFHDFKIIYNSYGIFCLEYDERYEAKDFYWIKPQSNDGKFQKFSATFDSSRGGGDIVPSRLDGINVRIGFDYDFINFEPAKKLSKNDIQKLIE